MEQGFQRSDLLTKHAKQQLAAHRERGLTPKGHDTLSLLGRDAAGRLGAVVSTSGMAFKRAGRVGDSPIPGSGYYADDAVGAAAASGDGDDILRFCPSFRVVALMREGRTPAAACEATLMEIRDRLARHGEPMFEVRDAAQLRTTRQGGFAVPLHVVSRSSCLWPPHQRGFWPLAGCPHRNVVIGRDRCGRLLRYMDGPHQRGLVPGLSLLCPAGRQRGRDCRAALRGGTGSRLVRTHVSRSRTVMGRSATAVRCRIGSGNVYPLVNLMPFRCSRGACRDTALLASAGIPARTGQAQKARHDRVSWHPGYVVYVCVDVCKCVRAHVVKVCASRWGGVGWGGGTIRLVLLAWHRGPPTAASPASF